MAEELQTISRVRGEESFQEQPAEQAREHSRQRKVIHDNILALPDLKAPVSRFDRVNAGGDQGEIVLLIPSHDRGDTALPARYHIDQPTAFDDVGVGDNPAVGGNIEPSAGGHFRFGRL